MFLNFSLLVFTSNHHSYQVSIRKEMLNEKEKDAVLNLHREKLETSNLEEKLADIFSCNCIEIIPINSVALYTTIPR